MTVHVNIRVPYTYLPQQFDPGRGLVQDIIREIVEELTYGRFTLGPAVERLETAWALMCGVKHAIGVNSGTDALKLILKALGIHGHFAVLMPALSFIATAGAAIEVGAEPVFLDIAQGSYLLNPHIACAVGPAVRAKAIMPVWWAGLVQSPGDYQGAPYMIEDACQAVGASYDGKMAGSFGVAAAFSLHPLKNVNVWGDGGMVTTNDEALAREIRLLRNHGLQDRDNCARPGYNSRLDTIQAIVGWHALKEMEETTQKRNENARRYDEGLCDIEGVTVPERDPRARHAYHLYVVYAERRDALLGYLAKRGVEAKIHYPILMPHQPGLAYLRHEQGDFPVAEKYTRKAISLPIHQYLTPEQVDYTIQTIREFYKGEDRVLWKRALST